MMKRERLREIVESMETGQALYMDGKELFDICNVADLTFDAVGLLTALLDEDPAMQEKARGAARKWLDVAIGPQAPGATDSAQKAEPEQATAHSEPGKPAVPLERSERKCADRLAKTSEAMMNSYRDHLDKCRLCTLNWQNMRNALSDWHGVTR